MFELLVAVQAATLLGMIAVSLWARATWILRPGRDEERFILLGQTFTGRVVVIVHTYRNERIRIISARIATRNERRSP